MTKRAWVFILGTIATGAVLAIVSISSFKAEWFDWMTFAVLVVLATLTQLAKSLFESKAGEETGTTSYSPTLIFLFAGTLLLSQSLFILLVIIPHLVEWANETYKKSANLPVWYIQPFNIATHIIAGLSAAFVYHLLNSQTTGAFSPLPILVAMLTVLVYVSLNHYLIGQALVLARKVSWRESGVWSLDNLLSDTIMTSLGFAVAVLWILNPWLILPALAPIFLIQRSLMVPQLKQEARLDAKTGLWNARHFAQLFGKELERASRFNRSFGVVMADLDLLRNINNSYGHLAGDAVLAGVGQLIRNTIREYDIAARFGGEEFAILVPEVGPLEARELGERIRRTVEATPFAVPTSPTPIYVTMSLGISHFPEDAATQPDLIHLADLALYQAKLMGRNCTVLGAEVPRAIQLRNGTVSAINPVRNELEPLPKPTFGTPPPSAVRPVRTASDTEPKSHPVEMSRLYPRFVMPLLVSMVIALSVIIGVAEFIQFPHPDLTALGILLFFAILAEGLKVTIYEDSNLSSSLAITFMAALLTGISGVILVGAAIVLVHAIQMRPVWYKSLFNWSTHVLAGAMVVLVSNFMPEVTLANSLFLVLPILIAGVGYLAIETGLIATAIAIAKNQNIFATWRLQFGWVGAHYLSLSFIGLCLTLAYNALGFIGVIVFVVPIFLLHSAQKTHVERTERSVNELKRVNAELSAANAEIKSADEVIRRQNDELFDTLGKIIDARDPYVLDHAAQVASYAEAIGRQLNFSPSRLILLRQAALLHDIGKIGIPEGILQKPGALTSEEYEIVKKHPSIGASFLETCQGLRHLATFVRHHHERWDGMGYPDRLKGEQVPIEARILSVCDAAEAMSSNRPYHRGEPLAKILSELQRCSGKQFDPLVVDTFIDIISHEGEHIFGGFSPKRSQHTHILEHMKLIMEAPEFSLVK